MCDMEAVRQAMAGPGDQEAYHELNAYGFLQGWSDFADNATMWQRARSSLRNATLAMLSFGCLVCAFKEDDAEQRAQHYFLCSAALEKYRHSP